MFNNLASIWRKRSVFVGFLGRRLRCFWEECIRYCVLCLYIHLDLNLDDEQRQIEVAFAPPPQINAILYFTYFQSYLLFI